LLTHVEPQWGRLMNNTLSKIEKEDRCRRGPAL